MQVQICQHKKYPCLFVASDGHKLLCVKLSFKRQPSKQASLRGLRKKGRGGDEGEKHVRKKGRDRLPPPQPSPPFFLRLNPLPLSTPAINRRSSSLFYMLARGWHVLRQTD